MRAIILSFLLVLLVFYQVQGDFPCSPRKYNHNSVVCVCNSTYCDEVSKVQKGSNGSFVLFASSLSGQRFERTEGNLTSIDEDNNSTLPNGIILNINRSETYQTIIGFGGAFTDAAGIHYESLSEATRNNFMNAYFSDKGLQYNLGRVPIAGCDFSTHPYAYNMFPENDLHLSNFSLAEEDYLYKIPLIKEAQSVATEEILLLAAAWSPPLWMKTNDEWGGVSRLLEEYYQTWADYHLKFLEEYDRHNITFWSISTGNEPMNGVVPFAKFNSLGWLPEDQALWVAKNLGPTIKNSKFKNVHILALDDQRYNLPQWIDTMEDFNGTLEYIDGIAVHWYVDFTIPVSLIDITHERYPDKFLIATEACVGDKPWQFEKVELGSWSRAELYIEDILEDLNHWFVGWVDWNLILNKQGGPNWYNNFVDAPTIVMPDDDEFLKQPIYYGFGHFTKFIPRGSKRVQVSQIPSNDGNNVAFLTPDGGITVVLYNPSKSNTTITVQEEGKGFTTVNLEARSVYTLVYY